MNVSVCYGCMLEVDRIYFEERETLMRLPLDKYLDQLSWSQADLARQAEISVSVVRRVLNGEAISRRNAKKIVQALDENLHAQGEGNEHMTLANVEGIQISELHRKPKEQEEK